MLGYDELLTETCSYEHYNSVNKYNEKTYDTPITINCFTSYNLDNILSYSEQEIKLNKIVFIKNDFIPDARDKVDGFEIRKIEPIKGLITQTIGWKITL